jgi:hypothetical protein
VRNSDIIGRDAVCSLCGETTLQIQLNCGRIVAFSLFHFSSFSLLVCFEQPLEVVVFKLTDVLMFEFLCNLNRLVPPVKFLVHCHSLLNFVVLNKDSLCLMELFVEDSKLCLDSEVISSFLRNKFVQFTKIVSTRHITESSVTPFSDIKVLLFKSQLG